MNYLMKVRFIKDLDEIFNYLNDQDHLRFEFICFPNGKYDITTFGHKDWDSRGAWGPMYEFADFVTYKGILYKTIITELPSANFYTEFVPI